MSCARTCAFLVLFFLLVCAGTAAGADTLIRTDIRQVTTTATSTPMPATGVLTIESVPTGAYLSLDGVDSGVTPLTIRAAAAGWHSVTLRLSGYLDYSDRINVPAGGSVRQVYTLTPVVVTATPAPAVTVTCTAPCQCLEYSQAVNMWGNGGFSQCGEQPCEISQSATGAPIKKFCYQPKQVAAVTTSTAFQALTTPVNQIVPVTTTTSSARSQVIIPVNPYLQQVQASINVCHYDPTKNQCGGICPQTGKTCVQVNESTCGDATGPGGVKCGCVNTGSSASLAASGLARTVVLSHNTDYRTYSAPQKGVVDSVIQLITGLWKKNPDLSSADPRAYTMDASPEVGVLASGLCPADLFRTTLMFADRDTAFISTDTGTQKGTFSWDSADPRVRSAVWQVSIFPFPMNRDNWSNVPGLLAQGNLEGDDRTFSIDFSKSVPTAADTASVWADRRAFLTVQKNALSSLRTDLLTSHTDTPGINSAVFAATRQKQATGIDTALVKINDRIVAPAAYTLASASKTGTPVYYNTNAALGSGSGGAKASSTLSPTYIAKGGVLAPVLSAPALTKAGVAGSLPQNQRTLFVRVVPFDQYGNYTNNPSNTKEVVIGSPRFNATSPWSGWNALTQPDQTGFAGQPEMVNFGDRLYLFSVRSDHLVYTSSIDKDGTSSNWVLVPGSPQTDRSISAAVYERDAALGSSPESHLYIFVTRQDTGLTWYARMNAQGAWGAWTPVKQKDTTYTYELEKAIPMNGNLYLLAQFDYRKYNPNDMSYSHVATSYVYQKMTQLGNNEKDEQWLIDWQDTGVATSGSSGKIAGATTQLIVGAYQDLSDQPHFIIYYPPSSQKPCASCNPVVTMTTMSTINVPPEILNAKTSADDLSAASYHGRLYFFVRGKNSHIYMDWVTILNQLGSTKFLGSLHGWEDISPDQMAAGSSITALPSPEGDRLDVFANNIQKPAADSSGWAGAFFSYFFAPQSTGMHRNSLGAAPENTQLLASFSGEKVKQVGDIAMTGYGSKDINISWTRTTPFWFAWNSSRPDLYYAEWQVSTTPFDEIHPKFNDKGIVSRGRLSVSDTDPNLATYGSGYFDANALPGYTNKVHLFPVNFPGFATAADPANPSVTPYYLRVIAVAPTTGPGSFTAYVSEQTEVDWGKQDEFVPKFCTAPTFYYYNYPLPKVSIVGYTPIQPRASDYQCHAVVTTGHTYYKEWYLKYGSPGLVFIKTGGETTDQLAEKYATQMVGNVEIGWTKYLCDPPADKSWWDKFVEGFEELISLMASLVNNIADAYNGVKATVISSLCGGNSACITVVSTGVDVGLAAIGVPPTLPNFDKLMDEGADYLAATVADESGIPGADIVTKEALKQGIKDVAKGMQNVPNPNDVYGLQPDPNYLYQPAHLMIELRNDDPVNTTPPGSFRFEDSQEFFKTTQPDTPFPSLAPGQVMTFPLTLKEDQWKGMTCTESLGGGSETWTVPCDEMYAGQISTTWWSRYQNTAAYGDSFTLYYDGMSANFTSSIKSQMEQQYGVPLDTYHGDSWMQDYKSPDCFAEKHQLVFQATDTSGKKISYDPINRLSLDSLLQAWQA